MSSSKAFVIKLLNNVLIVAVGPKKYINVCKTVNVIYLFTEHLFYVVLNASVNKFKSWAPNRLSEIYIQLFFKTFNAFVEIFVGVQVIHC